jgi:hypothetical protein
MIALDSFIVVVVVAAAVGRIPVLRNLPRKLVFPLIHDVQLCLVLQFQFVVRRATGMIGSGQ